MVHYIKIFRSKPIYSKCYTCIKAKNDNILIRT